jgi:geranylgeranyl reductase family protein
MWFFMDRCDVLIVGAGAVGCYFSNKLALEGYSVVVIDKKREVGKKACSGLISIRIDDYLDIPQSLIMNKIYGANFNSKNESFDLISSSVKAYVVDRFLFDNFLFDQAKKSGVKFFMDTCFKSFEDKGDNVLVYTSNGVFNCDVLIGCDGACSKVRGNLGVSIDLNLVKGVVAKVKTGVVVSDGAKNNFVELFYGPQFCSSFFAWKIPRGSDVEFGVACKKDHLVYFDKFLKRFSINKDDVEYFVHPICYGFVDKSYDGSVGLLGDASLQVKPFSGGGIVYGFICADILLSSFKKYGFTNKALVVYDKLWREKLSGSIERGLCIRKTLDILDDSEMDEFIRTISLSADSIINNADMDFL